jgi:hypothetical protein
MERLIIIFLAGILAGVVATRCEAASFNGNEIVCDNLAGLARDAAQMRDAGIKSEVFFPWLNDMLLLSLVDERSYIKGHDDVVFVVQAFKRVYDSEKITPEMAQTMTYIECMKVGKTSLLRGRGAPKSKGKKT